MLTSRKTLIMGILNVTPDSFSDGGKYLNIENAINHAKELIKQGVDIVDIGGESTRPGAEVVSEEEELRRVIPVVKWLSGFRIPAEGEARQGRQDSGFRISIDTYKSNVAKIALESGANIINDVSGLTKDPEMVHVAANANCKIVIMHNTGIPAIKPLCGHSHEDGNPDNESNANTSWIPDQVGNDIVAKIYTWLENQINYAIKNGIKKENIIIDPGIGFGKIPEEDLYIIENLKEFKSLGFPVLVGPSKKSFIKALFGEGDLEKKSQELIELAISNGADIVRVHYPALAASLGGPSLGSS